MRAAAIDIGSNTLRMLIGDIQGHEITRIFLGRAITRLAQGMANSSMLGERNVKESLLALKGFSRSLVHYGIAEVRAVGTSALRDARNRQGFIDTAFRETRIRIEVISGIREAELTLRGVTLGMETEGCSLIIDIGGGSTEWILSREESPQSALYGSLPLGVVTLSEKFMGGDPPSHTEVSSLAAEINAHLEPLRQKLAGHAIHPSKVFGTGGSITTLGS
ncbi:MAG TPA: hypothetical protein VEI28_03895, partial [Thermodesulfovibrionales bacterium]|nr:hypothetical protein [Thermodesulfovibrionales bacterium]